MTMDKAEGIAAMEVERFSKLGTLKLQQGHPQKALEAYKSAYQSAQALGHHGYMQRACAFNLGAMLISVGNYHEGLTYLNQAVPPEGRRDGRSNGDLYFNYGLAYEGLKNLSESKRYFVMALKEYRTESNNFRMEADTVNRLGKICVASGQYSEAESWMRQLIQAYDALGETEKKFHAKTERANLLLKMDQAEEAEEVADDCLRDSEYLKPSGSTANVFIELGLVYTQLCKYDKALQCSETAVPLVQSSSADPKQAAVLYQNLGAVHNYMGHYENAIKYHQSAASKHAELKNRRSQGHCFINMGYAYSQLKDMDKAGECFLHALQAAKDCGDWKSEWQSLEALGSVYYHQGALKRSQDCYKEAVTVLGKSGDTVDTNAQDRIMGKLTFIIQLQVQKPKLPTQAVNLTRMAGKTLTETEVISRGKTENEKTLTETEVIIPQKVGGLGAAHMPAAPQLRRKPLSEDGSVIAVRKEGKVKYLRVRRSGSLRKFKKVALGLEPSTPFSSLSLMSSVPRLDPMLEEEILSAHTTDVSDMETDITEESSEESDEEEKNVQRHERPHDSFIPRGQGMQRALASSEDNGDEDVEAVTEGDSEEDDDKKQLIAVLEQHQEIPGDDGMIATQTIKKEVVVDVHAEPKQMKPSTSAEFSGEDSETYSSSSGSESSEEEDEVDSKDKSDKNQQKVPPVPSMSPQPTNAGPLRTYETPANSELHYETIDHKPPSGRSLDNRKQTSNAGERISLNRRPSDEDGCNFFHSDEDDRFSKRKMSNINEDADIERKAKEEGGGGTLDATVYETIRPPTRRGRNTPGADKESDDDDSGDGDNEIEMSKGERDIMEFKAFQEDMRKRRETEKTVGDQKSSKNCIIM